MAWTASKSFARYWLQATTRGLAYDLDTDAYKVALYNTTITPDNTVTTDALTAYNGAASQWVLANEITGTNWAAGGVALASITVTQATANVTFTAANTSVATVTVTATGGCLVYDTTVAGSQGVAFLSFGGSQSCTAATFGITYAANGIVQLQC